MAKPFVVSISHELGAQEAKRRLSSGITYLKGEHGKFVTVTQDHWEDDRLIFEILALGQTASGSVEVGADQVTISVQLPLLLAIVAEKARALVQKEGQHLLEKK